MVVANIRWGLRPTLPNLSNRPFSYYGYDVIWRTDRQL